MTSKAGERDPARDHAPDAPDAGDGAARRFASLLDLARSDPAILAFWLDGSRGKGMPTEHSDYDCTLMVEGSAFAAYHAAHTRNGRMDVDVSVMTLDGFRACAAWGRPDAWMRYNYARLRPLVDKTGLIQDLLDEKGRVPEAAVRGFIESSLDAFVNQAYRSIKCSRDNQTTGARLEAAAAVAPLLDAVFALNGARLRPYYKYLVWEMTEFPLAKLPAPRDDFLDGLLELLASANVRLVQETLAAATQLFRSEGFGAVLDAWGDGLPWALAYAPSSSRAPAPSQEPRA